MPFMRGKNLRLFYKQWGNGSKLLLLIHGWGFSSDIWKEQADFFSQTYTVMAVDLPGHGKSPFSEDWRDFSDIACILTDFVFRADFREIIVAGWSLGAAIAARTAYGLCHKRSQRTGLVMVGSSPSYISSVSVKRAVYRKLRRDLEKDYPDSFLSLMPMLLGDSAKKYIDKDFAMPSKETLLHSIEMFSREDLAGILPDICAPSLVVHGGTDKVFSIEAGKTVCRLLPTGLFLLFPKGGHALFMDSPEEFYRKIYHFCENQCGVTTKKR